MGNCLRVHSSVQRRAGDEWEWETTSPERGGGPSYAGEKSEGQKGNFITSSGGDSSAKKSHEVKIKITKKQLEELLGRVDVKELSVEQVLVHLMDVHDRFQANQRSWRPALQSIPEVN